MPPRPASIKVRALQWLAQREHSRDELRTKLLRALARPPVHHGADADAPPPLPEPADPAAEVEALLQWLEQRGYLSQARFVESRVHARQARYGNLRIERELQQHGVALDVDTRAELRVSELQRARSVWHKKYGQVPGDAAERLRQMRFLAGRGFSAEVVRQVLRGGADDGSSEADAPDGPPIRRR